jgi:light-regulated signal transduction histidine kinase (bacteriophytochrome)
MPRATAHNAPGTGIGSSIVVDAKSPQILLPNGRIISCDLEPIHIPGAIQSHGVLFVLSETIPAHEHESEHQIRVVQVSENSADYFGTRLSPAAMLSLASITELIPSHSAKDGQDQLSVLHDPIWDNQRAAFEMRFRALKEIELGGKSLHFVAQVNLRSFTLLHHADRSQIC